MHSAPAAAHLEESSSAFRFRSAAVGTYLCHSKDLFTRVRCVGVLMYGCKNVWCARTAENLRGEVRVGITWLALPL